MAAITLTPVPPMLLPPFRMAVMTAAIIILTQVLLMLPSLWMQVIAGTPVLPMLLPPFRMAVMTAAVITLTLVLLMLPSLWMQVMVGMPVPPTQMVLLMPVSFKAIS